MGRFWQWFLFIGLLLWLTLVGRALWPVLRGPENDTKSIVGLLFLSTVVHRPVLRRGADVGRAHAHLRGRVLALVAGAPVGGRLLRGVRHRGDGADLHPPRPGADEVGRDRAVLFATIVFMAGGVLGTLHHLYFVGTPTAVVALGASFSALEVVPLAYIGFEAYHTYKLGKATPWMARYRWPIMFFIAVSFWNLVGAGLFGFLINPPLSLYYMQGLNLTPLHGHTALFGVYGMLGIALMLFCMRGLRGQMVWDTRRAEGVVLVPQHRPGADGAADPAAAGHDAAAGGDRARLCVCALGRVHAAADRRHAGVDARAGRHDLQRRRGGAGAGSCSGCGSRRGARSAVPGEVETPER